MYSKTQYGKVIILIMLVLFIMLFVFYAELKNSDLVGEIVSLSAVTFFVILTLLFYRLKVEVTTQKILITFGIGLIKKSIDMQQIKTVEAVKNKFWYGWGIRLTAHGWLWNIEGFNAVELTFKDNKNKFRIGCKDSIELKLAIESILNE